MKSLAPLVLEDFIGILERQDFRKFGLYHFIIIPPMRIFDIEDDGGDDDNDDGGEDGSWYFVRQTQTGVIVADKGWEQCEPTIKKRSVSGKHKVM